jgi:molybdenum transport protein
MLPIPKPAINATPTLPDHALADLLDEDCPYGDLTTESIGITAHAGTIQFAARCAMRVCGSEEALRMLQLCGADGRVLIPSGLDAEPGALLLEARGPAGGLHRAWKAAQTLMEWTSGIASRTAEIVAAARRGHPGVQVAATRKSVPGTRRLSVKAVRAGGAVMHRTGLSDTLLIFAEHRHFLGGERVAGTIARLRQGCPEKRIVVEVHGLDEALAWADADVIQLEKLTPEQVAEVAVALAERGSDALIAAAGGINAGNAEAYARFGARVLVTTAPHLAPPRDVQVRLRAA